MAKFVIYKDRAGEYRWRFKANNGLIVADSAEGYTTKAGCKHGIQVVRDEARAAELEDVS